MDLSIIIVSYNTKEILQRCLTSLIENLSKSRIKSEIIVVDNASTDGSIQMLSYFKKIKTIVNKNNVGYSKANNQGVKIATGKYILFLNSDVIVDDIDFKDILNYLDNDQKIGGLTVKVILPDGRIDPASHRGFPTIWRSFCYFSKLEKIFRTIPLLNKIFGGYHLTYKNLNKIHMVESPSGAFYLTRLSLINQLKGFSEDYFMYGEDLDLSFRIKALGYKIIYYPKYKVVHHKYSSGLAHPDKKIKLQTKKYFYDAMKIFYQKHYSSSHPEIINNIIYKLINAKSRL